MCIRLRILLGSDREGLGIGLGLLIIDRQSEPDRRSEPKTMLMIVIANDRLAILHYG